MMRLRSFAAAAFLFAGGAGFAQPAPPTDQPPDEEVAVADEKSATVSVIKEALGASADAKTDALTRFEDADAARLLNPDTITSDAQAPLTAPVQTPARSAVDPAVSAARPVRAFRPDVRSVAIARMSSAAISREPAVEVKESASSASVVMHNNAAMADLTRAAAEIRRPAPSSRSKIVEVPASASMREMKSSIWVNLGDARGSSGKQVVEAWYRAQIPPEIDISTSSPDRNFKALFLTRCQAADLPSDVDAMLAGEKLSEEERSLVDRAEIELALEQEGITGVEVPSFAMRRSADIRPNPDPGFLELNSRLFALFRGQGRSQPMLVLERYCGKALMMALAMKHTAMPLPYQIELPAGLVGIYYAPLFFAKICEQRFGSRYWNSRCERWKPLSEGGRGKGLGGYRLVAKHDGDVVSYRYLVEYSGPSDYDGSVLPISMTVEP